MAEGNGSGRMDRIERALELMVSDHEQFRAEHKQLLTAQILQREMIDNLVKRAEANEKRWEEQEKRWREQMTRNAGFDTRVDKLVSSIGELIGRIPPATPRPAPVKRSAKKRAGKKAKK